MSIYSDLDNDLTDYST